jgi:hypothetical protein
MAIGAWSSNHDPRQSARAEVDAFKRLTLGGHKRIQDTTLQFPHAPIRNAGAVSLGDS